MRENYFLSRGKIKIGKWGPQEKEQFIVLTVKVFKYVLF